MAESILKEKSFHLALRIIRLYQLLQFQKREYVLSKQLLRSGTSIGANIREAQNAESDKDFIHKLAVAQKECDETLYWLELLGLSDYLSEVEYKSINEQCVEVMRMVTSAIITSKKKLAS